MAIPQEHHAEVSNAYRLGEDAPSIARRYGTYPNDVYRILRKANIQRRSSGGTRLYECDHHFFDLVDSEPKAYWLGFLAADGYVGARKGGQSPEVIVGLQHRDREHLVRLLSALKSTHPIHDYTLKSKPYSKMGIRSKGLAEGLAKHNVTQAKTWTLRWPQLPERLYKHFLRGYNDGDGGFYVHINRQGWTEVSFRLAGNPEFLLQAQQYLMYFCALRQTKLYKRSGTKTEVLVYNGRTQVGRIFFHLYDGATVWLPRKRDSIEPHLF